MTARGAKAFFALCGCGLVTPAFSQSPTIDPGAAEALLRIELDPAKITLNSDVCVKADGEPLAAEVVQRLQESGIKLAGGNSAADCPVEIYLGRFSFRSELGTYELQFTSTLFGGDNVAVLKRFDDGWHVITAYHVGVWL